MAFKLVDSLIGSMDIASTRRRSFLLKSQFSFFFLKRATFCSENDENNSSKPPKNVPIKELLNSSSPLRLSATLDVDNAMWATSPYPVGTVFRDTEATDNPDRSEKLSDTIRSVILFPGQGNQFVGMGKNLLKYPVVLEMFETAKKILKYDLKKICLEGPENLLNDTKYCQPATFVCSLGLLERIKDEKPWALSQCTATCGYSLGEMTALVFAGCLDFETGLKLVKLRAEAMAECCKNTPGGMLTIFVGPRTTLGTAFSDAIEHCRTKGIENPVCAVASYLYPNCKIIAGNTEALDFLANNAQKYGIRRHSKLPVSGAFHSSLMKDAADSFKEELQDIQFQKPLIKVYSNVTGKLYKNEHFIKKALPQQIYCPVRWEQVVHSLLEGRKQLTYPYIYECGPGSSLSTTIRKINHQAAPTCYSVKL